MSTPTKGSAASGGRRTSGVAHPQEVGHYVVTAHKASSVLHALQCNFTGQATKDVLVAKAGSLEVRRLSHDDQRPHGSMENTDAGAGDLASLPLLLDIPIRGRICILLSFRPPGADRDFIFLSTERHKYAILSYQEPPSSSSTLLSSLSSGKMAPIGSPAAPPLNLSLENVITHDIGMLNDMSVGREAECGPQAVVADGKCIALHMYDGFVKIFPFVPYRSPKSGKSTSKKRAPPTPSEETSFQPATLNTPTGPLVLGAPFQCRLQEHTLLTMVFLMENMEVAASHPHLAKLAVLHQDSKGFQHVITHCLDLKKREFVSSSAASARRSGVAAAAGSAAAADGASAKPAAAGSGSSPNTAGPKKSRVDAGSCLVIPVPPLVASSPMAAAAGAASASSTTVSPPSTVGTGGLLVIGQMQIMYVSANNTGTKVLPIEPTLILCHTALPQRAEGDPTFQCLLADERGILYLLDIRRNPETGACISLIMDTMGLTSIATSLISVSPTVLYVGSRFGDSQLLQICPQRDRETNSFLQILEEYTNLGPIVDLDLVDLDRKGQSQVVTCSGTGRDGSIRIVRNGIGIHEQAHVELPGIKGMWNLRGASGAAQSSEGGTSTGGDQYDRYLVQSFLEETRVLEMTEDEMEETMIAGFRADQPTLFAGNVHLVSPGADSTQNVFLVQITESLVILVDATTLEAVDTWKPPSSSSSDDDDEDQDADMMMMGGDNKQITVASGNGAGQLLVALRGGIMTYLQVSCSQGQGRLEVKATKKMEHEVSCINLNPLQDNTSTGGATTVPDAGGVASMEVDDGSTASPVAATSDLCAVGLWNDVSVRLLNLSSSGDNAQQLPLILEEVVRLDLGGETQARSLLLASLEQDQPMLLVGLGDGQLISYFLKQHFKTNSGNKQEPQVTVVSKKKVSLGTQSISLTAFRNSNSNNGNTCVFATGDRPTIVYMTGGKVLYSNINLTTGDNASTDGAEDTTMSSSNNNSSTTTINHVTSFHCELFPDCLCLASEETLRIGTIDDIQKLHVQTYPLRETPQRIAHHFEGRLFAVACLGDGMNAQGDNPSALSQAPISATAMGRGNAILFLDDTTLEDIDRVELEPFELIMAMASVPLGGGNAVNTSGVDDGKRVPLKSYIVVGTGFAYPDEDEPTRGRILVYESTRLTNSSTDEGGDGSSSTMSRRVRQVTECMVKGGVYSMAAFLQNKIAVTVNQMTHIYELVDDSAGAPGGNKGTPTVLVLQPDAAAHSGHILSLCVKTRGNQMLIGDIMRSLCVLEYIAEEQKSGGADGHSLSASNGANKNTYLDEVARDYNGNWTTAVEILSKDTYLGAENYNNLFTLKRNIASPLEEIRCRLETQGEYNLGQMVNKLARGSLVMPSGSGSSNGGGNNSNNGSAEKKDSKKSGSSSTSNSLEISVGSQTLYGTVDGSIGCILGLDRPNFAFMKTLEQCIADFLPRIGGLRHEEYRAFIAEKRLHPSRGFVDGDLVESFLDLSRSQMDAIVGLVQKSAGSAGSNSNNSNKLLTVEDVVSMVEEMSRLH